MSANGWRWDTWVRDLCGKGKMLWNELTGVFYIERAQLMFDSATVCHLPMIKSDPQASPL